MSKEGGGGGGRGGRGRSSEALRFVCESKLEKA
jgi:hypothetical protein